MRMGKRPEAGAGPAWSREAEWTRHAARRWGERRVTDGGCADVRDKTE